MLLGKFSWHFGGKWGLYFGGIVFICVPGSPLSWSSDFLFFGMCSTSSSSERPEQYASEGEVDLVLLGLGHESDGSWAGELLAAWDSS